MRNLGPVGSLLVDRFRIESLIGTGGMASVYRAQDVTLGRTVAVKLFRADGGASEPERQSGEIALLASLNHFALVTLFDAGTAHIDGVPRTFIVMELVDGPDLRTRLSDDPLTPLDAAVMGADLAEALHYVHEQGIIHRDVKPANVIVPDEERPSPAVPGLESAHVPARSSAAAGSEAVTNARPASRAAVDAAYAPAWIRDKVITR